MSLLYCITANWKSTILLEEEQKIINIYLVHICHSYRWLAGLGGMKNWICSVDMCACVIMLVVTLQFIFVLNLSNSSWTFKKLKVHTFIKSLPNTYSDVFNTKILLACLLYNIENTMNTRTDVSNNGSRFIINRLMLMCILRFVGCKCYFTNFARDSPLTTQYSGGQFPLACNGVCILRSAWACYFKAASRPTPSVTKFIRLSTCLCRLLSVCCVNEIEHTTIYKQTFSKQTYDIYITLDKANAL